MPAILCDAATVERLIAKGVLDPTNKPARPSKYRNQRIKTEDGTFDSQGEYRRWCELKILQRDGALANLRRQVDFKLIVNDVEITTYRADFVYRASGATRETVEDFKGFVTPEYRIKKALMLAVLGLPIVETRSPAKPFRRSRKRR